MTTFIGIVLPCFGEFDLFDLFIANSDLNDKRRHAISYAQCMFQSFVYEGALGIIARRDIGHRSDIHDVDPHIGFQYVRTVAITWRSHVIST